MPVYTSNFSSLLLPGVRKFFGDDYAQRPEEYSSIFNVETATLATETDQGISGFGLLQTKAQGANINFDVAYQGYSKTYTQVVTGLGFIVTREMYEDDQYRKIRQLPKALSRSVRHSIEITHANILNNAFTTETVADGLAIGSLVHILVGGGTFSNMPSTAADFDMTSLEQALIDISNFVDDRSLKINAKAMKVIVPPQLDWQTDKILKSDTDPENANSQYNPAKGRIGKQVLSWLTDPDAWFILTDVPNGLNSLWKRRPEFTNDSVFDSENAKYKVTCRYIAGCTDPRALYLSAGA